MKTTIKNTKGILRRSSLVLMVALAFIVTSCEDEDMSMQMTDSREFVNIPATIDAMNENPDLFIQEDNLKAGKGNVQRFNSKFKTLRAALDYTGLQEAVSENRLTVLAPTDMAFEKLFSVLGVSNITELPQELVTNILLYHVIPATVYSGDLSAGSSTTGTLLGEDININVGDGMVMFNYATVEAADIKAMNGVIHAISNVLLPPSFTAGSIYGIASTLPDFSILTMAVAKAGLVEELALGGQYTVFAPNNDAFLDLLVEMGWSGLGDIPQDLLVQVLLYHVVAGEVFSGDLPLGDLNVTTLQGGQFTINKSLLKITDANSRMAGIAAVDVDASNGVIHVIDTVILP